MTSLIRVISNPELEIGRLVATGPMDVKANDIQFSSQVEIVDGEKPVSYTHLTLPTIYSV